MTLGNRTRTGCAKLPLASARSRRAKYPRLLVLLMLRGTHPCASRHGSNPAPSPPVLPPSLTAHICARATSFVRASALQTAIGTIQSAWSRAPNLSSCSLAIGKPFLSYWARRSTRVRVLSKTLFPTRALPGPSRRQPLRWPRLQSAEACARRARFVPTTCRSMRASKLRYSSAIPVTIVRPAALQWCRAWLGPTPAPVAWVVPISAQTAQLARVVQRAPRHLSFALPARSRQARARLGAGNALQEASKLTPERPVARRAPAAASARGGRLHHCRAWRGRIQTPLGSPVRPSAHIARQGPRAPSARRPTRPAPLARLRRPSARRSAPLVRPASIKTHRAQRRASRASVAASARAGQPRPCRVSRAPTQTRPGSRPLMNAPIAPLGTLACRGLRRTCYARQARSLRRWRRPSARDAPAVAFKMALDRQTARRALAATSVRLARRRSCRAWRGPIPAASG